MHRFLRFLSLLVPCSFVSAEPAAAPTEPVRSYESRVLEGWSVQIQTTLLTEQKEITEAALLLLQKQLVDIVRLVPPGPVQELRKVTLWFSPPYPNKGSGAEYHPDAGWLRSNQRNPAMAKGVEFSGIKNFAAEMDRMPNFTLHELSHAYHDRVLSFEQPEILAAYHHAKDAKLYDSVQRWHGTGKPLSKERAYGISNHKEYFAEATEAYFVRNDFFPFTQAELKEYDPVMFSVVEKIWGTKK
jgi:hypothetical protein